MFPFPFPFLRFSEVHWRYSLHFGTVPAYSRWWEARTVWGNIINSSRIFARVLFICTEAADRTKISAERTDSFLKESVFRHTLCNMIERDLKEMTGEKNLPEKSEPVNGILM